MEIFPLNPPIVSVSGNEIREKIIQLENIKKALQKELDIRNGDGNTYKYGYFLADGKIGGYTAFDTFKQAADAIVKESQYPDKDAAPNKVHKVYL